MYPAEKFVPNYYRLESHLRESLRNGALRPGDPVPPESSLCQQFGVSRTSSASAGRQCGRPSRAWCTTD
ncbi:MAG: Bacterial regulatory protein, gntR family [candidate division NC10 bacterium]|nr:Bacterial regulatory protein, gntR family [candidate division NC10 bacterium]